MLGTEKKSVFQAGGTLTKDDDLLDGLVELCRHLPTSGLYFDFIWLTCTDMCTNLRLGQGRSHLMPPAVTLTPKLSLHLRREASRDAFSNR